MIKVQRDFPLLAQYKKKFAITPYTVFAYGEDIYTNYTLPDHTLVHENRHLKQQAEIGLDKWVKQYLADPKFRLEMELDAFRTELATIRIKSKRHQVMLDAAHNLSSALYGNIITKDAAIKALK